jgi:endonuclease G
MKKKQKRSIYYLLAVVLLGLAGYHGYQKNGFYKSAYNEDLPVEQSQQDKQEGKEYQSTGDLSLLDVKFPERLDNQTVHYKSIVVYFNKYYRVPNCVAYELTNTMTSMADSRDAENRANYKFERDYDVKGCPDWWEYKESGYTRGHMAPAADMKLTEQMMRESFYFTNICPQNHNLNSGDWKALEDMVRDYANKYGNIYVTCGPIITDNKYGSIGQNKVTVPDAFYKVMLILTPAGYESIGFIMENKAGHKPLSTYAVTVDEV